MFSPKTMASLNSSLSLAIVLIIGLSLAHLGASIFPMGDKITYLVAHNAVRATAGLPPLVWNETVAKYARSYAQQRSVDCGLMHSMTRDYGENIAMSTGDLSPTLAIKMWADEKPNYDYGSNTCAAGQMCGHYTQLVWRNTKSIGCASATCQTGGTFLTCNYYPPGNYLGERPY